MSTSASFTFSTKILLSRDLAVCWGRERGFTQFGGGQRTLSGEFGNIVGGCVVSSVVDMSAFLTSESSV